jgi:hypothetical protein
VSVNNLREMRQDAIHKIVSDDIDKRLKRYERVANDFAKFFNQDLLQNILEKKVDKDQLQKITQT